MSVESSTNQGLHLAGQIDIQAVQEGTLLSANIHPSQEEGILLQSEDKLQVETSRKQEPLQANQTLTDRSVAQTNSVASLQPRRQFLQNVGTVAAAAALTGLAVQPAQAQEPSSTTPAMRSPRNAVISAAAAQVNTPPLAVLALNRMGFGPRPGDVQALLALADNPIASFEAYVEQQLNPAAVDDSACDAKIASYNFTTLAKSRSQLWIDHVKNAKDWNTRMLPAKETERVTFVKAIYSKRQLNEALADFWHNHFNVYAFDYWTAPVFVHYDRDVIRANMLGNFRAMVGAVAESSAMIYYLDNASNTSAGPNENYARELFELHTLGAENYMGVVQDRSQVPVGSDGKPKLYIDKDVYQATQCFTGWRVDDATGEFKFDESVHAKYEKIVLNTPIGDFQGIRDGQIVLDLLANHYGTATYICRKLCRRLISDTPSEAIVKQAADLFYAQRAAPDQLKQVVRLILLSDEFKTTWAQKVKRPFEFAVSVMRATYANFDAAYDHFYWQYENAGQPLFQWHPPDGYPDVKESWSTTMPMLQRWRMANWLLSWTLGGDGADKDNPRIDLFSQLPATITTPPALVDYWSDRLLGYQLPAGERESIIEFMAYGRNPEYELPAEQIQDRLYSMVGLILMSPSFLWR